MFKISAEYVPVFYTVFSLSMVLTVWWMFRRYLAFREKMGIKTSVIPSIGNSRDGRPSALYAWPQSEWKELKLPAHERTWVLGRYSCKLAAGGPQRPFLWFLAECSFPFFRQPKGRILLETDDERLQLDLRYANGEESAEVRFSDRLWGYLRLEVQNLPSFLADVDLLDSAKQPIGRWRCTPLPGEERNSLGPMYGPVQIEGRQLAEMQVFAPWRWRQGRFQAFLDYVPLGIMPNPPLYGRDAPLFSSIAPDLSVEERRWLLALLALQLYKLSFRPQGYRRV